MNTFFQLLKNKGFVEDKFSDDLEFSYTRTIETVTIKIEKKRSDPESSFQLAVHNFGVKHSIPVDLLPSYDEEQLHNQFKTMSNFLSSYVLNQAERAVESLQLVQKKKPLSCDNCKYKAFFPHKCESCHVSLQNIRIAEPNIQRSKYEKLLREYEAAGTVFQPYALQSIWDSCLQLGAHDILKNAINGKRIRFAKEDGTFVQGVVNQVFSQGHSSSAFDIIIDGELYSCDYKTFNFEFV